MRLKRYQDAVRIATEDFQAISLQEVPREHNQTKDAIVVFASVFDPNDEVQDTCKVQVIFLPSVPDNFDNWEFFDDDEKIRRFMANADEYAGNQVDWRKEGSTEEPQYDPIPMERVSLEKKFDRNDRCKLKDTASNLDYEEVNIGSQKDLRPIKVGKILDS